MLAGPNGVGKTTASAELLRGTLGVHEFVNADTIAKGLSEFNPEGAANDRVHEVEMWTGIERQWGHG